MKNNAFFPLFVDISEKKIVVIGGGAIATRRVKTLLPFAPQIVVVAPEVTGELEELENEKKLTIFHRVEGRVAYKGTVEDTVFQLMGGLRSGMGYCGTQTIEELKENGRFIKISAASLKESHPHDIHITKEAPNYSVDE